MIGIMCCNEFAERPVQAVATRFLAPLSSLSGATALMIPALADLMDVETMSGRLDGLLLAGSRSNLAGHRYGRATSQGPSDEQRDEVALSLASRMIERGRPVFGICRGFQELNVLFGGSLRDLDDGAHQAPPSPCGNYEKLFRHEHEIALTDGGVLAGASARRRLKVNSAHQQGVERLGSGLDVEAVATDDGLVEAFSARPAGAAVLAVQWHPEVAAERCAVSRSFYRLIGLALRGAARDTAAS
jgi:putative glutamine amidotransferase